MVSSEYYIQDNSDIENKTMDAAKNLYNSGKFADALKLYKSLLNTSISYKLYYEIGRCHYKLDDLMKAEEYFNKSIAIESLKNPSYLYLGNLFYRHSDIKNAIENWSGAYAYKPDDEAVCLNLATSYFSKGMKFQSVFYYEKYLKYAKNKGASYIAIKNSIDKCNFVAEDFLQKAKRAIAAKDNKSAIECLMFAVKNLPCSFDINHLLGQIYLEEDDYMHSQIYLRQALCLDSKSLDVLQKLASVYINLGDYTAAYCMMRRLLPLVLHNQAEYLKTVKLIKDLDESFDDLRYQGSLEWAQNYDRDNNYHMAILEYENCLILNENLQTTIGERLERLKTYINPEARIINACMTKGGEYYLDGDYKTANKYFSKVLLMSNKNSLEYKLAKSRFMNV